MYALAVFRIRIIWPDPDPHQNDTDPKHCALVILHTYEYIHTLSIVYMQCIVIVFTICIVYI